MYSVYDFRHFVLAFHDDVLESVAKRYSFEVAAGPPTELLVRAATPA